MPFDLFGFWKADIAQARVGVVPADVHPRVIFEVPVQSHGYRQVVISSYYHFPRPRVQFKKVLGRLLVGQLKNESRTLAGLYPFDECRYGILSTRPYGDRCRPQQHREKSYRKQSSHNG